MRDRSMNTDKRWTDPSPCYVMWCVGENNLLASGFRGNKGNINQNKWIDR